MSLFNDTLKCFDNLNYLWSILRLLLPATSDQLGDILWHMTLYHGTSHLDTYLLLNFFNGQIAKRVLRMKKLICDHCQPINIIHGRRRRNEGFGILQLFRRTVHVLVRVGCDNGG